MFRLAYSSSIRAIILRARLSRSAAAAKFSSTSTLGENQPNEPVDLDPSFKALLRDVDISLLKHKQNPDSAVVHPMPPLQVLDVELVEEGEVPRDAVAGTVAGEREGDEDYHVGRREPRKSPAALFGSQSIGEVILPLELRNSIDRLVEGVPPYINFLLPSINYSTQNRIKEHSTAMHFVSSHTIHPHPLPAQNTHPKKPGKHRTSSEHTNPPNRPQDTQRETGRHLRPLHCLHIMLLSMQCLIILNGGWRESGMCRGSLIGGLGLGLDFGMIIISFSIFL
jgi:hypothetical protein